MSFSMEQVIALGVDLRAGLEYTGGNDKYASALQRFYKSSANNKIKLKEYFENHDWENFSIVVHALKSNAKMIGALSLSSKFEALEIASKNNNIEAVKRTIRPALEEYAILLEALKPLGDVPSYKAEGEIGGSEAREVADKLLLALDDFDDEQSTELVRKLSGYPFRITQKEKLKEAMDKISDFCYEEASELIREIIPAIE